MRLTSLSRLALTLLLAPACHLALGADNAPSVESFFKDPVTRSATLSPQGHYVALVTRMADGKQVLAVRDTSDLKSVTVPLTAPDDNKIVALHWINEQRIGFTLKNYRIEFESNQDEFAVDRDGSNLVHLISGNFKHHQDKLGTNIKDKVLTSDYAFVSTTHDGSDDIIVSRYMWNNIDPYPDSSRLYRLNTRRQTLTDLLPPGQPAHALRWITDADASPRIAIAHAEGHCIDYYRAPGSADWKEIANADCNKRLYTPLFFDGAGTLYVTAAYKGYSALFRYNVETQTRDKEPMLTVPGFDYHGAPLFDTSSRKLLGIRLDSDAVATVWFDARFKALQKKIDALLPQTNNAISCAADCLNAPAVLVTSASDRQPTEYFIYTLANGAIVGLGGSNPDIKPAQMGLRDFYHYTARDGLSIPVYVTTPPGKAGTAWPTVVLVHGPERARRLVGVERRGAVPGVARLPGGRARIPRQRRLRLQALPGRLAAMGTRHADRPGRRGAMGGAKRLGRSQAHRHHGRQLRRLCDLDGAHRKPRDLPLRRRMGRRDRPEFDVQHQLGRCVGRAAPIRHAHDHRRPGQGRRHVPALFTAAQRRQIDATAADGAWRPGPPRADRPRHQIPVGGARHQPACRIAGLRRRGA